MRVTFDQPYLATPVVTANMTFEVTDNIDDTTAENLFNQNIQYIVTAKDQTGFTILLNKNAPQNIRFSWVALGVKDAKIIESVIEGLDIETPSDEEVLPPPTEEPLPPTEDSSSENGGDTSVEEQTGDTADTIVDPNSIEGQEPVVIENTEEVVAPEAPLPVPENQTEEVI